MAFARVQGGSSATNAVTLGAAVSANSTILGAVSWDNGGTPTITSITDDKGNTYTVLTNILDTTNNQRMATFALGNIDNAPITITVNFSGATIFTQTVIDEFSGGDEAANNRDGNTGQFQNAPGTGANAITSGNITTTQNGDLIWGVCVRSVSATQPTIGTGFAVGTSESGSGYAMRTEFLTQTTAGAVAATYTQGTASQTLTSVIAVKAPATAFVYVPPQLPEPPRSNIVAKKAAIALIASGAVISPWALTQPETVTESRWHQNWSEPLKFKRDPRANAALAASGGVVPLGVETITPDKWFNPFSEPKRFKSGLRADLQQTTTLNPYGMTQPEAVQEDKWHQGWSEPIRIKPGLSVRLQQTTAFSPEPVRVVVESEFHYPWSEPVRRKARLIEGVQSTTAAIYNPEVSFSWYGSLSDPVRKKPLLNAALNPFIYSPINPVVSYSWFSNLSTPVLRARPVLQDTNQAFLQSPFDPASLGWIGNQELPPKAKSGLRTDLQQAFTIDTKLIPDPGRLIQWYGWLSDPVRTPRRLHASLNPFISFDPYPIPNPASDQEDRWHQPWSEPVRKKPVALMAASGLSFAPAAPFPEVVYEDRWHFQWTEPVRIKRGLYAWYHPYEAIDANIRPVPVPDMGWLPITPHSVWGKPLLREQRWWIGPERLLPTPAVSVTVTLNATEINDDSAEVGIWVYDPEPSPSSLEGASVTITEIPANNSAGMSIREP